ncbi:MAG: IMP dehydrogenase [Candidatus Pacebacteria bacterium]|nr:IMP dehydrogenase [Candidatus Paceibacterota bacterium]
MNKPTIPSFSDLLKERVIAEKYIEELVKYLKKGGQWRDLVDELNRVSTTNHKASYPDQGLTITAYDVVPSSLTTKKLSKKEITLTLKAWLYYLELFNHPERLESLFATNKQKFKPPQKSTNKLLNNKKNYIVGINEFSLTPQGATKSRTKRTERFRQGPFIKLGNQARSIFVGSANPDIWGSSMAIASMAMAHCLCGIPRDGFFSDPNRQTDLAINVIKLLKNSPILEGKSPEIKQKLFKMWIHNLVGVLEANPKKAKIRTTKLYKEGIRSFRIYSPEPGLGALQTLKLLKKLEKENNWEPIEIFVGQVVSTKQALALENAGATGIYLGIGGGGRCTTGVRSGVGINWPQLVWEMRGKVSIPLLVEGGGSDYVAQSLSLGVSAIGVTRAAGGATIESPGGVLYFEDEKKLWKPYRGEASAGMKAMGGRIGPFGFIPYVEGEGTRAYLEHGRDNVPTILQKLNLLFGDAVMALVFQNAQSIEELQKMGAKSLRLSGEGEVAIRHTH